MIFDPNFDLLSERPPEEDDDHEGHVGADSEAAEGQEDGGSEFLFKG